MCRYHDTRTGSIRYKCKYVCLECRYVKKAYHVDLQKCVKCGKLMHDIGLDYRPPRKSNRRGWKKLAELVEANVEFHSCGCSGPTLEPRKNNE